MAQAQKRAPISVEALRAKAELPAQEALKLHPFYRGKIEVALKACVRSLDDFAIWYTPGVAAPCRLIAANRERVYDLTNKGNTVAIVSDGTRILGLGDIGPEAGLPVMEGKSLLFKYLGGVDAWPLMLDTKDPDELIDTVLRLQPSFGGVNLEDIAQPKCFKILDQLRVRADIPVWHDDQQGTATVTLAALQNALTVVGKKIDQVSIVFVGAGAANIACARLIFIAGANPQACRMVDSRGVLHRDRSDLKQICEQFVDKWHCCQITNREGRRGGIAEALRGADVVIALSRPGPDVIRPEWIRSMAKDAIVFACANPTPEIWPWEASEAGAAIIATGRSDFPNQVNNSLGFPGIFRGTLDVRAKQISDGMCLAAADALAAMAREQGLEPNHILPTMEDWSVFPREAAAVAVQAVREGLAEPRFAEPTPAEPTLAGSTRASEANNTTTQIATQSAARKGPHHPAPTRQQPNLRVVTDDHRAAPAIVPNAHKELYQREYDHAEKIIRRARDLAQSMMHEGFIPAPPP